MSKSPENFENFIGPLPEAVSKPENMPDLTNEQMEMLVGRVIDVLSGKERSIAGAVDSIEQDKKQTSRDDAFYDKFDKIILDKVESVIMGTDSFSKRFEALTKDADRRSGIEKDYQFERRKTADAASDTARDTRNAETASKARAASQEIEGKLARRFGKN